MERRVNAERERERKTSASGAAKIFPVDPKGNERERSKNKSNVPCTSRIASQPANGC